MRKRTELLAMALLLATFSFAQKPALLIDNEPGWTKIGETVANFSQEDESIIVLGDDQFSSIKLKVLDASLTIDRLQVFYESGEMKDFDVKSKISRGDETRDFTLNPSNEVSKVAFTYHTIPNTKGEKAKVVLYGFVRADKPSVDGDRAAYNKSKGVSDNFSRQSAKALAEVADKEHESKSGPDGQKIYVEEAPQKYYYVDKWGQKVYVSESQLKDKPEK